VIKIQFFQEYISEININKKLIKQYLIQLIKEHGRKAGTISIIFCSDEYLLKINKQYLNHDFFTDVITFDYCENEIISGDIFISIDRISENSEKFQQSFNRELLRVLFHGILHLVGYNDKTREEKKIMKEMENFYLNKLMKDN
jgi:probable rRNA maturation factor